MEKRLKRKVVAGAVVGLAVAGAGGAIAATRLGSPQERSQAIVADAAKQLGIPSSKLTDALKKAVENQIDAAVQDGRLSKEQGAELKARIESGVAPLFGGGPGPGGHYGHPGHGEGIAAAAAYLGLTEADLRSQLESGKTLAQIAEDRGKAVDGLIQALVDEAKTKLDAAVTAGRLTKEREDAILTDLKQRITDFVNNGFKRGDRSGDRFAPGSGDRFGPGRFGPGRFGPGRFGPGRFGGDRSLRPLGFRPPPATL